MLFCHRWLGLISGLVVFIVSVTGCIFCFQDEIQDALYSYRTVESQGKFYIAPSQLFAVAKTKYPKAAANFIYYYGKNRPAAVLANMGKKKGFQYVFLNPYTGAVTHVENPKTNFFTVVESIHLYLLLPPKIGKLIVGISVIIFVVIMITGIVLWWPKRKTDRKRSFTIKWGARWRRVNYDLHNVLGFYATSVAIILAVTGLSIAFPWMSKSIYSIANLGKKYPSEKIEVKSDSLQKNLPVKQPVTDLAFNYAQQHSPRAEMFLINNSAAADGTVGVSAYAQSMHFYDRDEYNFDKYSGKLLQTMPQDKKSAGLKMNEMNYDIHVGQILGLTGKIIAFLTSLICASLPVTGLIIWLGKRKKKTPRRKRRSFAPQTI